MATPKTKNAPKPLRRAHCQPGETSLDSQTFRAVFVGYLIPPVIVESLQTTVLGSLPGWGWVGLGSAESFADQLGPPSTHRPPTPPQAVRPKKNKRQIQKTKRAEAAAAKLGPGRAHITHKTNKTTKKKKDRPPKTPGTCTQCSSSRYISLCTSQCSSTSQCCGVPAPHRAAQQA